MESSAKGSRKCKSTSTVIASEARQSMPLVGEIGSPRYARDDEKRYFGNFQLPKSLTVVLMHLATVLCVFDLLILLGAKPLTRQKNFRMQRIVLFLTLLTSLQASADPLQGAVTAMQAAAKASTGSLHWSTRHQPS